MKKKMWLMWLWICGLSLIVICLQAASYVNNYEAISTGNAKIEQKLQKQAKAENMCIISEVQGIRTDHFSKYGASDQHIYFAYNNGSMIDAYDHSGVFRFSIIMPDARNGGIEIYCTGDQLHAWTKEDDLYIFEGQVQVEHMTWEEAKNAGYDLAYDYVPEDMRVDKSYIYLAVPESETVLQISTPKIIRNNWPSPLMTICFGGALCVSALVLGRWNKRQV